MRKTVLVAFMLMGVVSLVGAEGSLSGTVIDRTTSLPIAGAIVTVHVLLPDSIAFPDTSGATGSFAIDSIISGNEIYVVMAGKPGYKGYYFRFDDIGTGSQALDIILEPEAPPPPGGGGDSSEVSGQVLGRDATSGELSPVSGAEIRFVSGTQSYLALSDLQGEYRTVIGQGSYAITVSAPGYQDRSSAGVTAGSGGLIYGAILVKTATDVEESPDQPGQFALTGAYPNPFNPTSRIRYTVASGGGTRAHVTLTVHDLLGRELSVLINEALEPGSYEATFDARGLPSGVYICRLRSGASAESAKLVLMR